LRQDREVGTANPAAEDRPPQGERDDPRYRDDGHERDQRGAERFPLPRHLAAAVELHEVRNATGSGVVELHVHRHHVGTEAEVDALAEREHATAAPGESDADGHDRETHELPEQRQPERRQQRGSHHQQCHGDAGETGDRRQAAPDVPAHRLPRHTRLLVRTLKIPCGRTCRNTTTTTSTPTFARLAVVEYSNVAWISPRPNAAITHPLIWPMPPATTTRNASTM